MKVMLIPKNLRHEKYGNSVAESGQDGKVPSTLISRKLWESLVEKKTKLEIDIQEIKL